jgi:hypothetical protein
MSSPSASVVEGGSGGSPSSAHVKFASFGRKITRICALVITGVYALDMCLEGWDVWRGDGQGSSLTARVPRQNHTKSR